MDQALVLAAGLKERLPGLSVSRDGHLNLSMAATVAAAMRCVYVDLDGTLLGPDASLLRDANGGFALEGVRALQACFRAGAEVVIYSGRNEQSVFSASRLIGSRSYIFELGCAVVIDGELEWLTGGVIPSEENGSIYHQISESGAPALLLERYGDRLEYHTPWSVNREVSHLFRGELDLDEVAHIFQDAGIEGLRLVDNGIAHEHKMDGIPIVHVYHLIPAGASKARAIARHMQARGYAPSDCIAVGDSREDIDTSAAVGTFWLVANAIDRDPDLQALVAGRPGIRLASESYGAGVYEAVVTTLAEGR